MSDRWIDGVSAVFLCSSQLMRRPGSWVIPSSPFPPTELPSRDVDGPCVLLPRLSLTEERGGDCEGGRRDGKTEGNVFVLNLSRFVSCRPMLGPDSEHLDNLLSSTQGIDCSYSFSSKQVFVGINRQKPQNISPVQGFHLKRLVL